MERELEREGWREEGEGGRINLTGGGIEMIIRVECGGERGNKRQARKKDE